MTYKRLLYTLVCLCISAFELQAQCPNNNTLNQTLPEPAPMATNTACCVWGAEYVSMPVTMGTNYTFQTCGGPADDSFITLYNDAGGGALAFDDNSCGLHARVDWTATFTGTVRALVDIGAGCGANAFNHPLAVTNNGSLPVEWVSFSGEAVGEEVHLTWVTALERESSHFEVERSRDGIHFVSIGRQAALGEESRGQEYRFADTQPGAGTNYYKVKEISLNGETSYHRNVLEIVSGKQAALFLESVYPVPAQDRLTIILEAVPDQPVALQLHDMLGRVVRQQSENGQVNFQVEMDLQGLKPANYVLSVRQGDMVMRKKVAIIGN